MEKIREWSFHYYPRISRIIYLGFLYSFAVILPLYCENAYFDMMEAKVHCFQFFALITLPALIVHLFLKIESGRCGKTSVYHRLLLFFLLVCGISTLCSYAPEYALSGNQGWYVGFFVIAFLIFTVFSLSGHEPVKEICYLPVYLTVCIISLFTIGEGMDYDILGFHQSVDACNYHNYVATLGNINWSSGFHCLFFPYFLVLYLKEKGKKMKMGYFLLSVLEMACILLTGADANYLGICFLIPFLLPIAFADLRSVRSVSCFLMTTGATILGIRVLPCFENYRNYLSGICSYVVSFPVGLLAMTLGILLFSLSKMLKEETFGRYRKKIVLLIGILYGILILLVAIVILNAFSLQLGNNRFLIWKISLDVYLENYTPFMKLFGIGPELLRNVYSSFSMYNGAILTVAHSEAIQVLLTMGSMGLLCWLGIWIMIIVFYVRNKQWKTGCSIYVCAMMTYLGQSFANSATCLNLGILTLFFISYLGVLSCTDNIKKADLLKK